MSQHQRCQTSGHVASTVRKKRKMNPGAHFTNSFVFSQEPQQWDTLPHIKRIICILADLTWKLLHPHVLMLVMWCLLGDSVYYWLTTHHRKICRKQDNRNNNIFVRIIGSQEIKGCINVHWERTKGDMRIWKFYNVSHLFVPYTLQH